MALLAIDADIRLKTDGLKSLDDFMGGLYSRWVETKKGKIDNSEIPMGLQHATTQDYEDFVRRYIVGTETLPMGQCLKAFGLRVSGDGDITRDPDAAQAERDRFTAHLTTLASP